MKQGNIMSKPANPAKLLSLAVDEIKLDPGNARTHDETQIAQLANSISEFGFNNPVLVDEDNGLIAGHGRLMAAKRIGLKKVPAIRLDHLTPAQRKAYMLADNKIALNAGWDEELLAQTIVEIEMLDTGIDLTLLGFSEEELLGQIDEPEETNTARREKLFPLRYARVLLSIPVDAALEAFEILEQLERIDGVEVDIGGKT